MSEWISVEDRLPEDIGGGGPLFIFAQWSRGVMMKSRIGYVEKNERRKWTHWMPLPAPPNTKEDNDG